MCAELRVRLLGALPLSPRLARAADAGRDLHADPALDALKAIVHGYSLLYLVFPCVVQLR